MQAWSNQESMGVRSTSHEPTKSGALGLICAALGVDREDDATLAELSHLPMAVRVDRPGSLLRDYQTVGGGTFRGEKYGVYNEGGTKIKCIPSERYYLQDASFVVAFAGDETMVRRIAAALTNPKWALCLGRRSCPMSVYPLIGVAEAPLEEAIRSAPFPEAREDEEIQQARLLLEAPPEKGGEPRYDLPLSFGRERRKFRVRYVRTDWVTFPKPVKSSPHGDELETSDAI